MKKLKIAAIGTEHRHIFGQLKGMLDIGCECVGWWNDGDNKITNDFKEKYPAIKRELNKENLLSNSEIDLVLIADIPSKRADLAIECMEAGKDVMLDKPGCTSLEQLNKIEQTVSKTKRIFSIDFSERFEVPSVQVAYDLIQKGEIGNVVQTIGMGPHRLNLPTRPEWFFDYEKYGGILCDIASHQIDQFLFFTGSSEAEIISSSTGNFAHPEFPKFEDFGEILIHGDKGRGYIRVDWYTPDALPNWGDGRLTIIGTEGYIELRKYVDVLGKEGTDHIYLVNKEKYEYINAASQPLTYFQRLKNDVINRTSSAMKQDHCLKVTNLAINAQLNAKKLGNLK